MINGYERASSFYGPGAVGCWYLTLLSCLVTWTLSPKGRLRDSIDINLVAVLTYPAVAAGDVILRMHKMSGLDDKTEVVKSLTAPLWTTCLFAKIGFLPLFISGLQAHKRRAHILCILWNFNVTIFAIGSDYSVSHTDDGNAIFLDKLPFHSVNVMIAGCIAIVTAYGLQAVRKFRCHRTKLEIGCIISIPIGVLGIFMNKIHISPNLAKGAISGSDSMEASHIKSPLVISQQLSQYLRPRTATSIKDLDQAVALCAGATVLCHSIYDAASAGYETRRKRRFKGCGKVDSMN